MSRHFGARGGAIEPKSGSWRQDLGRHRVLFNLCAPSQAYWRRRGGSSWRPLRYLTRAQRRMRYRRIEVGQLLRSLPQRGEEGGDADEGAPGALMLAVRIGRETDPLLGQSSSVEIQARTGGCSGRFPTG